jgi:hypothetical protein
MEFYGIQGQKDASKMIDKFLRHFPKDFEEVSKNSLYNFPVNMTTNYNNKFWGAKNWAIQGFWQFKVQQKSTSGRISLQLVGGIQHISFTSRGTYRQEKNVACLILTLNDDKPSVYQLPMRNFDPSASEGLCGRLFGAPLDKQQRKSLS